MSDGGARSDSKLIFDVDDLPDPAFSVTLNRRIVAWNAAAERYFSLRTADVIGHYCFEVVMPRREAQGMPCAFCTMATAHPERDTTPTVRFRTFAARSTSGETQLVHLLATPESSGSAPTEPHPHMDEQETSDLPPVLLTPREREVLRLLADGLSTAEIAARLSISRITARNHVTHVMDKLEVKSRLRAVLVATQKGLL